MGKYQPLTRYLKGINSDSWETNFEDVERVLGFELPESAHTYQAWWANQTGTQHSQTRGWQDAGFETRNLNLFKKRVRFERVGSRTTAVADELADLWNRASEITGVTDRDELLKSALTALIRREAARELSAMAGTMPDFTAPPRERPTW